MPATFDKVGMDDSFMQDQVGMGSTFLLNLKFQKDYGLEEEDEVDIAGKPLFEDELAKQAGTNKKPKSKRTMAYTQPKDKPLCEWGRDIGQEPKVGIEQKASTF